MHVHACVDAESEKPHGPRRHVGAGDRQPHGHISTRREGGGGGRVSPPSQQMSPFRIAGELGGLPWSKMWIAWNGPNRAYLPLHLCWAMGGGARPSMPRGGAGVDGTQPGNEEWREFCLSRSRLFLSTVQSMDGNNGKSSPASHSCQCLSQRKEGVRDAVVGKSGGGAARRE